mgnify:CR=1 FL=1
MLGLHQMVDRLGQREIIHSRIAQRQVQQLQKGDGRGGAGHNIQHQQLQIQFTLDILYGTWTTSFALKFRVWHYYIQKNGEDKALFLQPARPSLPGLSYKILSIHSRGNMVLCLGPIPKLH